uniref:Uncharacterized protein n=1 Tax=Branchiostoma floridae TaxID=7739 RepID=C3ZIA9_BRAFL|eukprot:XP_002591623.1 hypothetical protein BRAFLDRAFT_80719 [Branchiostoma floridae]
MAGSVSEQEWGKASLKICDALTVQEQATGSSIGAFYQANKANIMLAIGRAVEGHQDVRVGGKAKEDSPLVQVIFYSQLGYQYFKSILNGHFLQACLQTELKKIGYEEPVIVSVERWELPNLPEGEVDSWELVSMGTRGIMLDKVMPWLDNLPDISDEEDVEEEDGAGPSGAKRARRQQQPPAEISAQQAELQEGPLKKLRAGLLQNKDSPTAPTLLNAYSCLEKGATMVINGGYQEGEGVEDLLEGIILMENVSPDLVTKILYDQSWLNLDKTKFDTLITKQLKTTPDSTPCLLIEALQLPEGHTQQQAMNQVIDIVLQHGETDPMYKHLAYMYCVLAFIIWMTIRQPAPVLSAFASALMHKSDHLPTLFFTAWCSIDVSVAQAIRQFHHFIHTAPTDHYWVPHAHYLLVTLYSKQDPSVHMDRILHHYNMAQQTDRNRLPVFPPASSVLTDPARRVYEQVMAQPGM